MKLRFLLGALAAFALLGAGCSRTATPAVTPTATVQEPAAEAPISATPQAAAPTPEVLPEQKPAPTPAVTTPAPEVAPQPAAEPAPTPSPTPAPAPAPKPTTHAVAIKGFAYSVKALNVKVGDTVVWTQVDDVRHNVVLDDGSLAGPLLAKGETFSHTFTTKGTFPYHCQPHPSMKATVVVE